MTSPRSRPAPLRDEASLSPLAVAGLAIGLALVATGGCGSPTPARGCRAASDCPLDMSCIDAHCVARADASVDAASGADAACACAPGESCASGRCLADCGDPSAVACEGTDECDYATGRCVPDGTAALTGSGTTCGASGPRCLPGAECSAAGTCEPAPACLAVHCNADRSTCWGASCRATRPIASCTPAPLARLRQDDFLIGEGNGLTDVELDDACNVYGVTVVSGTDFLRQVAPDGALGVTTGVTNLNMGEVAVLRPYSGEFVTEPGEVALTYTCCLACGCEGVDPQGVARLDRATSMLPMVVTATPTTGTGPFGIPQIDSGPYGLTWGRDRTLYVGNVTSDGDLVRADLDAGTTQTIVAAFGARVYATATFDGSSLLVALADGRIERVSTDGAHETTWATTTSAVVSLVRDPFLGVVYVSLGDGTVRRFTADGSSSTELAPAGTPGRLAYSPDGALYYLRSALGSPITIERIELPTTFGR